MTEKSYLDEALKRIKKAKTDDEIKFIVADVVGCSSCSLDMVEEADEFCFNFQNNAKKTKRK